MLVSLTYREGKRGKGRIVRKPDLKSRFGACATSASEKSGSLVVLLAGATAGAA